MRQGYAQDVIKLHSKPDKIRNLSVIAHVDHGKTTLCDTLLAKAGLVKEDNIGKQLSTVLAHKAEEVERGITIKSTGISLLFNHEKEDYLINLVDSPGHVDFSSEVTAALRITDGALVVVDCVEGARVQTETVTRQALAERIRPVLHVNKVDRGITELRLTPEELYHRLNQVIESVNVVLSTYEDEELGDWSVDPRKGTVSFGSGKQGWAFTLPTFAKKIAEKLKKDEKKILELLWGDHFYDPETGRCYDTPISPSGQKLERYVCQVVFKPLFRIFDVINAGDMAKLEEMLPSLGVRLAREDRDLRGNLLISRVLQQWIPAADAIVKMMIDHLPSPVTAQKYRVQTLYTGPLDDENARAIRACDPNGPLMVFISKMVPTSDGKRFYAFGRVFSGTIRPQAEVRIMGVNYSRDKPKDAIVKKLQRVVLMMGKYTENVEEVPCGNTVGIVGIDDALLKSGTLATREDAFPIVPMKFSVSPVVRRAVEPLSTAKLSKFVAGLKRLSKSDVCLQVIIKESSSECIIAGAGELHIETALADLREFLGDEVEFKVGEPVVEFCESVSTKSVVTCLAKSPNHHNRLYMTAEPLGERLATALEKKEINVDDPKEMVRQLVDQHKWDSNDAKKILFVRGTNLVVDMSRGVQYLNEIHEHILAAFDWVVDQGALCGEAMRGVRFNLMDATLHADAVHRGAGQIVQAARNVMLAAELAAGPTIMEPFFLAEIQSEKDVSGRLYSLLNKRRGFIIEEIPKPGTPLVLVRANLPVLESFGFTEALRETTSGRAFPQLLFSHWQQTTGDAYDSTTLTNSVIKSVRLRKKLKEGIPKYEEYNEKL